MIAVADVALLRPLWILAALAVIALPLMIRGRGGLGDWPKAIDPALLAALAARGAVAAAPVLRARPPAAIVAAALIALGLAGPALQRVTADSFRNLDGLLVAVDLSRSMIEGGSLAEARLAVMEVVEAAGTRQAGLIVYAGDAYAAAPLTADRTAFAELVAAIGPDLVREPGSDAARAIRLSTERFAAADVLAGDLVLVTDAADLTPRDRDAAAAFAAAGHRLNLLFVPPSVPLDGAPAPDPRAAEQLSRIGGGLFATIADPAPLAAAMATGTAERLAASGYAVLGFTDFGRLLLAAAAIPLLLLFRRRI